MSGLQSAVQLNCCVLHLLICAVCDSVKAVKENIVVLKKLLPRIMELITSGDYGGPSTAAAATTAV